MCCVLGGGGHGGRPGPWGEASCTLRPAPTALGLRGSPASASLLPGPGMAGGGGAGLQLTCRFESLLGGCERQEAGARGRDAAGFGLRGKPWSQAAFHQLLARGRGTRLFPQLMLLTSKERSSLRAPASLRPGELSPSSLLPSAAPGRCSRGASVEMEVQGRRAPVEAPGAGSPSWLWAELGPARRGGLARGPCGCGPAAGGTRSSPRGSPSSGRRWVRAL